MECKCSIMITSKIDVSDLVAYSKQTGTKFYINFLYVLTKALNTRDDYKMRYLYQEDKLVVFDKINTAHYVFHEDTETFTVVYTEFSEDYLAFYDRCCADIEKAKQTRQAVLHAVLHTTTREYRKHRNSLIYCHPNQDRKSVV